MKKDAKNLVDQLDLVRAVPVRMWHTSKVKKTKSGKPARVCCVAYQVAIRVEPKRFGLRAWVRYGGLHRKRAANYYVNLLRRMLGQAETGLATLRVERMRERGERVLSLLTPE